MEDKNGFIGLATLVIIICIIVLVSMYFNRIANTIDSNIKEIELMIGEKVIFRKDTLIIIDYSLIHSSYTLEDGTEVSFELVRKLDTLKTK